MTKFFYELTKRNWGFPWHIIICLVSTQVAMMWVHWFWCLLVINLVGFIYERTQNEKGVMEDIIANNIGFALGMWRGLL